ncbi:MAG: tetratricopeptide repeat protein [Planctomycetota bacterium]
MLRLVAFFFGAFLLMLALRHVPVVGRIFEIPLIGFWGAAILLSLLLSRVASVGVDRASLRRKVADLERVDTPHNQGKLGSLLLAGGRAKAAVTPLERAVAGEPDSIEWRYRLGLARLEAGDAAGAADALAAVSARDEEYAYGAAQLALARALERTGRRSDALDALDRFERNHGPSPESACRRGILLKRLGRPDEARAVLASVAGLASRAGGRQKRGAAGWTWRAFLARFF